MNLTVKIYYLLCVMNDAYWFSLISDDHLMNQLRWDLIWSVSTWLTKHPASVLQ